MPSYNSIEVWCNGSTSDFGSLSPRSSRGISTEGRFETEVLKRLFRWTSVKNSNFMKYLSAMSSRLCDRTFTNFEENLSLFVKKFLY